MAVKESVKDIETSAEIAPKNKRRKLTAFWIFVIVYTAVIIIINVTAVLSKAFSDFYSDHIFRIAAATTGRFSGLFTFSLGEVLITTGIVLLAVSVIIAVTLIFLRKKQRYRKFCAGYFRTILVITLTVVLLYTFNCNIFYCSTPMSFSGGVREFDIGEFEELRNYVVEQCNELAPEMKRSQDGTMIFEGAPDKAAQNAMRGISDSFPRLKGYYPPAKKMWGSYFMYKSNIIGVYFPFSMEANYSEYVSDSYMPHVLAHEYAHLKGYIYESEANFMSFISCVNSEDDAVKYSGYLCVLSYLENDYKSAVPPERAAKQVQISELVRLDNNCYDRSTWEYLKKRDEQEQPKAAEAVEKASDALTEKYMEIYDYKPNYSEVTLLVMQYYHEFGTLDVK